MFPLYLFGTALARFTSLAPNSIFTWAQLEQKFHEYFYSSSTELRLSHLIAIKQKHNDTAADYIRRFRDTRNWYFNLNISDKDLAVLAYSRLALHLKEKLESHIFFDVSESRAKESRNFPRNSERHRNERHVNMVEFSSELSDNEEVEMCVAEWSWGAKSKPFICSSLKPASKSRQDEMRYIFYIAKCYRIFDYLLQEKQIKLPSGHVIPSPEQLKKHACCKWHNS
jgi:hypothetical protein